MTEEKKPETPAPEPNPEQTASQPVEGQVTWTLGEVITVLGLVKTPPLPDGTTQYALTSKGLIAQDKTTRKEAFHIMKSFYEELKRGEHA